MTTISSEDGAATIDLIPVRHMAFDFGAEDLDETFYRHSILASSYFHALSIFLTFGEDLVIATARHHRQFLSDEILKARVTTLIGQEAVHSKLHNEFNDRLADNKYPVNLYRGLANAVFEYGFTRLPNQLQLSLMAGIEHFTAVLAEYMMKHEEIFYLSNDEQQRALWMWHMLEESEHKDIAYDVYQELSGHYGNRMLGFSLAFFTIIFLVPLGGVMIPVLRKPKSLLKLRFWQDAKRSAALLFGRKDGVYGSTLNHILDYLRRDFHPNDHDTSDYLAYYKAKLLDPESGLLTPYLTREFIPTAKVS